MSSINDTAVIEFAVQKYKNLVCVGEVYTAQILWMDTM
jgi:hypothetical protein